VKNEKLLYFKNLRKISQIALRSEYGAWLFCICLALIYSFTSDKYIMVALETKSLTEHVQIVKVDVAFLPIIALNFVVPLIYRICEAWSNAVMSQLFD
jgi:hypothetical protein